MRTNPITFREKVEARFTRKGRGPCWMWEGSMMQGHPALNLRPVRRHIYQWERGPIPPGTRLRRGCHRYPECWELRFRCRHRYCVNPWHQNLEENPGGLYERDPSWDPTRTDHTLRYLHTQRRKKDQHDRDGNPKGDDAVDGGGAGEGPGMAQSGVG